MPKVKKKITRNFTTIYNTMVRDMRLGMVERGLLLTMLSLPDNWNLSIRGCTEFCRYNLGKQSIDTISVL